MKENRFKVSCPSCEALFGVTDPELLGQIVACPKCGGMMLIEPQEETLVPQEEQTDDEIDDEPTSEPTTDAVERPSKELDDVSEKGAASLDVPSDANDVDEIETGKKASGSLGNARLVLMASGVVCALLAALGLGVIRAHRTTPVVDEPVSSKTPLLEASDTNEPRLDDSIADAESVDPEANGEAVLLNEATLLNEEASSLSLDGADDGVDEFGAPNVLDSAVGLDDDENGIETEAGESVESASLETVDPSGALADEATVDDAEAYGGIPTSEEENDVEELAENDAIPTEFDEATFEKENQAAEEKEEQEEDLGAVASTTDVSQSTTPVLRNELKEIDVDSRMNLKIRSIVFPESPAAAVRLLSEFSGVPIEFELERFVLLRPSLRMRLDLKLDDVNVNEALAKEAEMLKWSLRKEKDRVVVEPLESELSVIVEQRFDVADLLADETPFLVHVAGDASSVVEERISPEKLAAFAKSLVSPQNWGDGEGQGTLAFDGTTLVVTHDSRTRKEIELLLERLRVLRRLNSESSVATENLIPENLGWETLSKKTSFNLLSPISLQDAVETLESKYKFLALWDDAALNMAGVGRNSSTGAKFESLPIEQVLSDLLEPHQLTFVILDERLVLITTMEKAAGYKTVEVHGFSSLDSPRKMEDAVKLAEEMMKAVAPESWNEPDVGLWLDVENACWIARQSQTVQQEIRRWTNALLEKEKIKEQKKSGRTTSPIRGDAVPTVASRTEE